MMLKRLSIRMRLSASIAIVIGLPSIGSMGNSRPQESLAADELSGRAASLAPSSTSGTLLGDRPIGRVDVTQEPRQQALADQGCNTGSVVAEEAGEPNGHEAWGCATGASCQASQLAWGKKPG